MARVVITSSADSDIYAIQMDLAKIAGLPTAEKYTALFDIRIGIVFPYIVIYRHHEADDTATVLRVIHGRRNITIKSISD